MLHAHSLENRPQGDCIGLNLSAQPSRWVSAGVCDIWTLWIAHQCHTRLAEGVTYVARIRTINIVASSTDSRPCACLLNLLLFHDRRIRYPEMDIIFGHK